MEAILAIIHSMVNFAQNPELATMQAWSAFGWTADFFLFVLTLVFLRSEHKSGRVSNR
jgi:hypothetical protein